MTSHIEYIYRYLCTGSLVVLILYVFNPDGEKWVLKFLKVVYYLIYFDIKKKGKIIKL